MANHTPGPWEVGTYWDPNGEVMDYYLKGQTEITDAIAAANARLIAAAPDLLEACKNALIVVELHYTGNCGAANSLRAAIAKAEGTTGK